MDAPPADLPVASRPQTRWLRLVWLARVFVVLVCLSLLTINFWQSRKAYEARKREGTTYATNLASSLAQHADATIKQADTILLGLVERVATDGTDRKNLLRLESLMAQHVQELPKLHGLFIYDASGRWLANSKRIRTTEHNNSDRDYFQYLLQHAEFKPFIGKPIRSRSTNDWILTVARRYNDAQGQFAGVVLATIHLDYFQQLYETYQIGAHGSIALVQHDGTVLLRRPFDEKNFGKNIQQTPLFREHLSRSPVGTYNVPSSIFDSQKRLLAYQKMESYPLVQTVSLSQQHLFDSWLQEAYPGLIFVFGLTLGLGFLGFRLLRLLGQRLETEKELQQTQAALQQLNLELEKMALQDGLTGLANRRQFDLALNDEFNRAIREHSPLALLMIDVDAFKQFNDLHGHPAGDECLRRISAVTKSCLRRAGDLAARYGGEEIAVLLPKTDLAGALKVAARIRQNVRDLQIDHAAGPAGMLTVSCGVNSITPVRSKDLPLDLLEGADRALYIAKTEGRDRIVAASQPGA